MTCTDQPISLLAVIFEMVLLSLIDFSQPAHVDYIVMWMQNVYSVDIFGV